MAQRVQVQLIDDMTGEEAQETVTFGLDGVAYEIDLTTGHANEMRELLGMYVEKARKSKGSRTSRSASQSNRQDTQRIRAWAQENGYEISQRGRINRTIMDAYQAAHATQ